MEQTSERNMEPESISTKTLRLVLVLHRHGARFPKKALACDLNWPIDATFWSEHSAEQSPEGTLQLHNLGSKLRARYGNWLQEGVSRCDMAHVVRAFSTNSQRTLNSAWALLGALLSGVPRHFRFPVSDRPDVDWTSVECSLARSGHTMGIAIEVEQDGPLKIALPDGYDRNKTCLASQEVMAMATDPTAMSIADELHVMTGLKRSLAPSSVSRVHRVAAMKRLATQLEINSSHDMPNFLAPNSSTPLSRDAVEVVRRAGDAVRRYWYRPVRGLNSDTQPCVADGVAPAAAGELGRKIAGFLRDKKNGLADKLRLVEMSAHSGNLLALASLLGVDISSPCFAAHWLFELHCSASGSELDWTVRTFYIPDPIHVSKDKYVNGLLARRMPLNGKYVAYEECPVDTSPYGLTQAQQLIDYLMSFRGR